MRSQARLSEGDVNIELTVDIEFDSFYFYKKFFFLRALRHLLGLRNKISVVDVKRGSLKITLSLTLEQAEQLLWLYKRGVFRRLKIKDAKMIGKSAAHAIVQGKILSNSFDVFMCHNSEDKPEVQEISLRLRNHGILPWLDEWELRPGFLWQKLLEEQISNIKSAAVFVGESGIGPWQDMELRAFINQFVHRIGNFILLSRRKSA
jgi:hypothetical protein